jgi:hypothetical protein
MSHTQLRSAHQEASLYRPANCAANLCEPNPNCTRLAIHASQHPRQEPVAWMRLLASPCRGREGKLVIIASIHRSPLESNRDWPHTLSCRRKPVPKMMKGGRAPMRWEPIRRLRELELAIWAPRRIGLPPWKAFGVRTARTRHRAFPRCHDGQPLPPTSIGVKCEIGTTVLVSDALSVNNRQTRHCAEHPPVLASNAP